MKKTCDDCIHQKVCLLYDAFDYKEPILVSDCMFFKDKSKFIEFPCSDGAYCTFGKELYRVSRRIVNGENDFYVHIYKVDKAEETFTVRCDMVTFISDEEAKIIWEELK